MSTGELLKTEAVIYGLAAGAEYAEKPVWTVAAEGLQMAKFC